MAKSRQTVEHERKDNAEQQQALVIHEIKYSLHSTSITVEQCNLFSPNGCERNALEFQRLGCTKYVSQNHIAGRTN